MNNNTANKITSSSTVFKSRHFHVDRVVVERSGKKFEKDIVERTPIVLVLPYTANDEIYLESQYRDALEKTCLEVVAGSIDENEDTLEAAKRELKEETGLTAKSWKKITIWETSVNMRAKIHLFFATDLSEGESNLQHDEIIELVKMPLSEVLEKIDHGEIPGGSHVAAILLFDKMRREGKI